MKKIFLTTLLAIGILAADAQPIALRGTVVDEADKPMKDVTVYVKEWGKAEIFSDAEGKFKIILPDTTKHKTLVFWVKDYPRQEYRVNLPENDIRFVMKKSAPPIVDDDTGEPVMLDEVTALGYGEERKRADLTGAISSVSSSKPKKKEKREASEPAIYGSRAPMDMAMYSVSGLAVTEEKAVMMYDRVDAEMSSMPPRDKDYRTAPAENIAAGTLTSGEVNDFAKWHLWGDVLKKDFQEYTKQWGFNPLQRYIAQLTNRQGMPVSNAQVNLMLGDEIIWQAKTDNTGKAELWNNFFKQETKTDSTGLKLVFDYEGQSAVIQNATPFEKGINTAQIDASCSKRNKVDIFFMLDATGSMSDEMRYLQAELDDIIKTVHAQQSELELRTGSLVYRDHGDEYLTRKTSLNKDINITLEFLRKQSANGGGDYEEAVDVALFESVNSGDWDDGALARILFIVLDAPSHTSPENIERLESQLRLAAELGIRIVPIACSDIKKDGEYLMRTFALATNGTYLFLTDDSGVGNAHIKPSTDKYEVEKLNEAIVRIIKQYTQMPDCNNPQWAEQSRKEEQGDKFVPNPYDENPDENPDENIGKLTVADIIKVYPNPCSDNLKVDIRKSDVQDIFLVDMTGKTLMGINAPKREIVDFDVRGLSAGVYFVRAFYKGKWFSEKIIKK